MNDGFVVFWIKHCSDEDVNCSFHFTPDKMTDALKLMEVLRKNTENSYVSMSSQNSSSVGQLGVTSVEDGQLPSGELYDWTKAHRAGKMRKSDKVIALIET